MKQFSKKLFSLVVLFSTANIMLQADCDNNNDGDRVLPFLQWRSQGRDTARKLYGTTSYAVYQPDVDGLYGTFNATLQYDQSFRNSEITQALFGASLRSTPGTTTTTNRCNDDCNDRFITISGLENADGTFITDRGAFEWMAENFYLPRDFESTISFSPKVRDVLLDLNLFVGLDRWLSGLYFRLYGPIVWNKASLNASEDIIAPGTSPYEAGYFSDDEIARANLFPGALAFFGGCEPTALVADTDLTIQPLRFAKFSDCNLPATTTNSCDSGCGSSQHKTGFAELRGELGWNYMSERYRLLLNIQAAAPTGSRPNAEYLLPAQIGNGKHWELGVGLGGSWKMWCSEDEEKFFSFIVEADITHLFNAKQTRTFDLKGKPMSRYMLAQRLEATADVPVAQQLIAPSDSGFQFADEYAPVANLTTRDVKVSIGVQGDLVAMFNYTCRGFSWDLGYNFWAMSGSKIHVSCDDDNCPDTCPTIIPFVEDTWALKGDASVFGFSPINSTDPTLTVPLGATESEATIFAGTNGVPTGTPPSSPLANPGIDSPVAAVATGTVALFEFNSANPINTSVPPVFISADDFDYQGAEQRGLSHKIFTHFSYTWLNHEKWTPYVGAGFSAEFGSHSHHDDCDVTTTTTTTIDTCPSSLSFALSKWAVEVKGGVSFH